MTSAIDAMPVTVDLSGKTCLVTGAAGGIGSAVSAAFLKAGANVLATDLHSSQQMQNLVELSGGQLQFFEHDLCKDADLESCIERTGYEGANVLFNNAGVAGPENFPNESFEQWTYILDVNLNGVFNMCNEVWPLMVKAGGGNIVNMSSGASTFGFSEHIFNTTGRMPPAAYSVAKAGVDAFTRYSASKGGKFNIRVNGVRPGQILTPMTNREGKGEHGLKKFFDVLQILEGTGYPDDIANAVLFLSCNDSRFITGEIMNIDGGLPSKL